MKTALAHNIEPVLSNQHHEAESLLKREQMLS
jgi:hypothetical protein